MNEPVTWLEDGSPYSPRFQDRYRPRSGALAQAEHVFMAGCGLPDRWRGQARFTVLETGFGLGQNFLATWAAWEADAQRCTDLRFVSVEAYPVSAADMARNLQPVLQGSEAPRHDGTRAAALAAQLVDAWHGLAPGVHDLHFAGGRVQLVLAIGQVASMLDSLDCAADAVYLDGFSPSLNPDMWSAAALQAVARHCRRGTTLATYTAASAVRRELEAAGFRVHRRAGLPPKRHQLAAVFEG